MATKRERWYKTKGLKPATGFITPGDRNKLKQLAQEADKSLTRYVSRLLEKHVQDNFPHGAKNHAPID